MSLNPEAPEFQPQLKEHTQAGYPAIQRSIQFSNALPMGMAYDRYQTFTDFNVITSEYSANVQELCNAIIVPEDPKLKLRRNDTDCIDKVIEANDNFMDRVNINIDIVGGLRLPDSEQGKTMKGTLPWTTQPVLSEIQMGSTSLIAAKNIPRPQINFKDPVDNTSSLFLPKITEKPNNIKPLALQVIYDENGEPFCCENPYKLEIESYAPPKEFIEPDAKPPKFPPPLNETKYTYIDTEAELDKLVAHLTTVKEVAVDLEHHSYRTYLGITCLMQLTTDEGGDFVVDTLAVREHMHKLNIVFTNPKILKVLHGAINDVLWLQRDFGVYIVGMFDTQKAAMALQLVNLSLKALLKNYCQVDVDKKFQLADWRIRPLPDLLIEYARTDTHYLLYIWHRMKEELLSHPNLIYRVFDNSQELCAQSYRKPTLDDEDHMKLYVNSKKSFNSSQLEALKILFKWRDDQARLLDESVAYLLPNHMLLSLAENLPREMQGVSACCSYMPSFVKQNLITIHRIILMCRELPQEPLLYTMPSGVSSMLNHQQNLPDLKHFHDYSRYPEFRDDLPVAITSPAMFDIACEDMCISDFDFTLPTQTSTKKLNPGAPIFLSPYDRYRKYRYLAQIQEIREFKKKEAKLAAVSKCNELIQKEVQTKHQPTNPVVNGVKDNEELNPAKAQQRKRKMSPEPIETKEVTYIGKSKTKNKHKKMRNKNYH